MQLTQLSNPSHKTTSQSKSLSNLHSWNIAFKHQVASLSNLRLTKLLLFPPSKLASASAGCILNLILINNNNTLLSCPSHVVMTNTA